MKIEYKNGRKVFVQVVEINRIDTKPNLSPCCLVFFVCMRYERILSARYVTQLYGLVTHQLCSVVVNLMISCYGRI